MMSFIFWLLYTCGEGTHYPLHRSLSGSKYRSTGVAKRKFRVGNRPPVAQATASYFTVWAFCLTQ